jgi:hypothetical protein
MGYWNSGMHLGALLINAVAIAKIKSSLNERHAVERALAEGREATLCETCRRG